jgi:hypothetical protein
MQSLTQHVTLSEARGPDLKRLSALSGASHPQGDS